MPINQPSLDIWFVVQVCRGKYGGGSRQAR